MTVYHNIAILTYYKTIYVAKFWCFDFNNKFVFMNSGEIFKVDPPPPPKKKNLNFLQSDRKIYKKREVTMGRFGKNKVYVRAKSNAEKRLEISREDQEKNNTTNQQTIKMVTTRM